MLALAIVAIAMASVTGAAIAPGQDVRQARAAYDRAIALEAEGNDAAALSLLWSAAGAAPGDAEIQNGLGEALDRLGALDAAVDAFRHALAARPGYGRAMNNLVVALAKAGRGEAAVGEARAWVAAAPGDPERLFTLALAQADQDLEAAMATLRQVLARRPDHALAHYNLALVLKRIDRVDDAIPEAERAVALDPRPEARLALGTLYTQRGDLGRAVTALEVAVNAAPRDAAAWLQLGTVLQARGDLSGAARALRRAIALRPATWSAHAALAAVLARAGDPAGARQASAEAEQRRDAERRTREAVVATAVGIARLDAGDARVASDRFRAAIAIDETYAPAHYHLGRTLQQLGRIDDARAAFAIAQRLNPSLVSPLDAK
jgi:tetratricopeptide (TPR) repeat protein